MLSEIDAFINWVRIRSPQAKTWKAYRSDLALFLSLMGDRIAADILPRDVDLFVNHQIDRGFNTSFINRRLAAIATNLWGMQ